MDTVNLFHGLRRVGGNTDFTDYLAVFPILAMLWCTELPTNTTTYVCVRVRFHVRRLYKVTSTTFWFMLYF